MQGFTTLDWGIFLTYVVVVFLLGLRFARQQHTNEDYFVGGRQMFWVPIGLSMFASVFSSNSFVGLPTQAAVGTYHIYLAILMMPVLVTPIVALMFVPCFHRLGVTSPYEYLDLRFGRSVRLLASLLFSAYTLAWMGNLLYAVTHILEPVAGLGPDEMGKTAWLLVGIGAFATLYTVAGGFKAVIWTDVLQGIALGGGMVCILYMGLERVDGGWAGMVELGRQYQKFEMFDLRFDMSPGSENVFSSLSIALFTYLPWYAATLIAVQRYVSLPSIQAAQRSLVLNAVMAVVVCLLFFLVGTTVFAFYHQDLPAGSAAGEGFPATHDNQLVPYFVLSELSVAGLAGLLLAGLFAAAMSSIDSGINGLTATLVCDWLPGRDLSVSFSRWLSLAFGTVAVASALAILYQRAEVYSSIIAISGTFMGLLLGVFLVGMLVPTANTGGALVGLGCGTLTLILLWHSVDVNWYGAVTCLPTLLVGWLASYFFPRPSQRQIRGLVIGRGRLGCPERRGLEEPLRD